MNDEYLRLDNQLCFLFYSVSRAITRMYGPLLDQLGVTYPQYLVLLILWETDNIEVNRITELLHIDTGTVSPMLKRLEAAGLIVRQRSDNDERKVIISLTKAGHKLKVKAATVPAELFCKTGLTLEEYGRLKAELSQILQRMEQKGSCG
ncbi:MAG TPA: MarR family transcriptional regulator [Spirochaetota bacterium]|nr:MarR family transcriptional regulator [Spirochaetota bacterium]HQO40429.1 MarR family transcriptional regulator [Spirochaetota bacterium]